LSDFSLDFLLI